LLYHELELRSVIALTDLSFENGMQFDAERVATQTAGREPANLADLNGELRR
jgi:hypothetical protein